ncbi:MAG: ShlB/FhaC/HecB family hemolysin secretion/activation protein [Planctomycetota bacterium]|jgi:hemolysin activation/secretion protein
MNGITRTVCIGLAFLLAVSAAIVTGAVSTDDIARGLKKKGQEVDRMRDKREAGAMATRREMAKARARRQAMQKGKKWAQIEQLDLPEDTTTRLSVKSLSISGNTLISTDDLLEDMPLVHNASDKPLTQAQSSDLYDLRTIHEIIAQPGEPRQVSARTIQGLTQYILSAYQVHNYAGIYVYVPAEAVGEELELQDGILQIEVLEAKVSEVSMTARDLDRNEVEEGYLNKDVFMEWSPLETGDVANQKELDDFINLLNLNPDRYVSARVSQGTTPESLRIDYDLYEADPWHWYAQINNAGSEERQWSPTFGLINTNLTGRDDRFTAIYQLPLDTPHENYSMYGSYEFPIYTPRLRLNLYGGHSEFDMDPEGSSGFNFFGKGSFYGGILRYNLYQQDGWFLDVMSSLSQENSRVNSTQFNSSLGSDVTMNLWGIGAKIHKSDDLSNTSVMFSRVQNTGGSSDSEFNKVRGADSSFHIYTILAGHQRYLDAEKITRLSSSLRWIQPNDRLVSAKMSVYGGLYTVRGYRENEIVADGGTVMSAQYEYDLVKHCQVETGVERDEVGNPLEKPFLRRFAPLVFFDAGRAKIEKPTAGEKRAQDLASIGAGTAISLGDTVEAAVYYGIPLRSTDDTTKGRGRWNFTITMRW